MWSTRRTFDEGNVESFDLWKHNSSCYPEGYHMNYINSMQSAFENMRDYINMWRVVLINEDVHVLGDLANHGATWEVVQVP